ncbi:MAG TPA: cyclic nucleotide-binding domain-containing protein [Parapedobacter sp.]|uniref:Crp/Fnr family transcriptional regulator n=1 Tax=Parapedobacter sp. TaxID=1958893 RepID=UPI002C18BA2F|nr:cyclic nucleotide-binding domain-containing protein [Parapedobacter sp.]HWK58475.1 cyclic nucleotide-binding domain-containing protein [Parapedobacter sp.]
MKTVAASSFPQTAVSEADVERVVAVLHSLCRRLHKPLPAAFFEALSYSLRRQELPKATVLVAAGSFPDRVYFLTGGSAVAYDGDRGDGVLWIRRTGDFILPDSLPNREKSHYTAIMEQEGTVLSISAEAYWHCCEAYPDTWRLTVLWLLAMRKREYERLTAIRSAASVAERICWLLQQWDDALAVFPDAILASYLETTREWLNKQKDAGLGLYRATRHR